MRRVFLLLPLLVGCSGPLALIEIRDVRVARVSDSDRHVAVEVDVRATEGGGGNLGRYCVDANFPGDTVLQRTCEQDLTDGDVRTIRLVSQAETGAGASIVVTARLASYIDSETRLAPP